MELNKIYLGDAYELIKQVPDKSIDLIYVDIPYDIHADGYGKAEQYTGIASLSKSLMKNKDTLAEGIDFKIFDDFVRVLKKIYVYIWCSKKQVFDIMKYFIEKYNCNYTILFWGKTNPMPLANKQFLDDKEICLCFYETGTNKTLGVEQKKTWYISPLNVKDKDLYEHPTIKPLEFVKQHILNSTNENDVVLDCFVDSGTTAVACKETNRNFIGFEIEKEYYDIANDRLKGITQKERKEKEDGIQNIFDYI